MRALLPCMGLSDARKRAFSLLIALLGTTTAILLLGPVVSASAAITAGATNTGQGGNGAATSFNLPSPAGVATGDLLVAVVGHTNSVATTSAISGSWMTLTTTQTVVAGPTYFRETIYYRIITEVVPPASYTVTTNNGAKEIATISSFRGVSAVNPITLVQDVGYSTSKGTAASGVAGNTLTATALTTPSGQDSMLLAVFCADGYYYAWGAFSNGMTASVTHHWGNNPGPNIATAHQTFTGGGDTGPRNVWYRVNAAQPWIGHLIALNDATSTTPLTVTATASNKTYDGTTVASVELTATGIAPGDDVTFGYTSATFATKHVADGKTVTVSGITIGGADASKYSLQSTSATDTANITRAPLTISSVVDSKVYDGDTSSDGVPTSGALMTGDSFTVLEQSFTSAHVGLWGLTITFAIDDGNGGDNYSVTPMFASGAITPKELTVTGALAQDKPYDGTTDATVDFTAASLTGVVSGDDVAIDSSGYSADFDTADVGTGKPVGVTGVALTGDDADNYTVAQPAGLRADIGEKELTVTGALAQDKPYDGTTDATVDFTAASLTGVVSGDDVAIDSSGYSADFDTADVGTGKPVGVTGVALTGDDADNYTVAQPAGLRADIGEKELTVTGALAQDKPYDGTTDATVDFTAASLTGVVSGDDVAIDSSGYSADFDTADVGTGKPVGVTGVALTGDDADNYTVAQPAGLRADIGEKELTVTGALAQDKPYDGTTDATVDFTAASLTGVVSGDDVAIDSSGYSADFDTADVGTGKPVGVTGVALTGDDADNYTVAQPAGLRADITEVGNTAPVAVDDAASVDEDSATGVVISVLSNDTDADPGDTLSVMSATDAAHGDVAVNLDGTITYTPTEANYNGPDSFTYIATDGEADSNVATVNITVTPVDEPPPPMAVAISPSTQTRQYSDPDRRDSRVDVPARRSRRHHRPVDRAHSVPGGLQSADPHIRSQPDVERTSGERSRGRHRQRTCGFADASCSQPAITR